MGDVGQRERQTQDQVLAFFENQLGYRYLGNWKDQPNKNVQEDLLWAWLKNQGHSDKVINKVLRELDQARAISGSKTLYQANQEVYGLLRYGVKVRPELEGQNITVWLIDWHNPANNDFAVAEEVTVTEEHTKRPDIVLYVNGLALGVLELKRSTVSVTEGIRQNLDNQEKKFIRPFFVTVQLIMAGNPTEGLRYGVIQTPEKYWLEWREDSELSDPLERGLSQLCRPERFLEIIHDYMVFDAGIKKTCRHNQYFGCKAAQDFVNRRQGGIIWHTQGSGKSLTMVWLAKWIREHVRDARVLIITDRSELDEQMEKVFKGVNEHIYRTKSGSDLISVLNDRQEWLITSLIHKFGASEEEDVDSFLQDLQSKLPKNFHPKGQIFVFVDECHRTQSGKLHEAMKTMLPGAVLFGFTGTPLLKKDKRKSIEVFGPYIHTYKYDRAVQDGVVLDLRYEARDIDQNVTAQDKIDQWFEIKTQGLSDFAKAQIKQRWASLQKVLSSKDRLEKIVADILWDMALRDRLKSGRGNAMLVAGSIYSACRFYEFFEQTELKGKCAIVTSYLPSTESIKKETTGEGETEKLHQYQVYRRMLAEHFNESEETAVNKVQRFEQEIKKRFINEPGQLKLLIVVDKLLTGFDAPPATYLYIDKHMRDHGLFQAICRVNRLDGEDKEFGYIIDYKDLFKSLEKSMQDYTGGAFDGYDPEDVQGLLEDRLSKAKEKLEETRESIKALCEPVEPPRDTRANIHYFCGADTTNTQTLKDNEPKRVELYKLVSSLLRAYAEVANEMHQAGYGPPEAREVKAEVEHFEKVRGEVKVASGDYVDMKAYEPAMRHLLDTYIRAEESQRLSAFDDMTLVDLIVRRGQDAIKELPEGIKNNQEAMAETIENNVRRLIVDEMPVNPKYYQKMSERLDALVRERRQQAMEYKKYLEKVVALTRDLVDRESRSGYPETINTPALQALYDNLGRDPILALNLDEAIRKVKKAEWRGNKFKEREVKKAIEGVLLTSVQESGGYDVDGIFELVKEQHEY